MGDCPDDSGPTNFQPQNVDGSGDATGTSVDGGSPDGFKTVRPAGKCFKCPVCDQTFFKKSHYTEHYRIHTGEKPFRCNECNKTFITRSHLTRHHVKLHTGVEKIDFRCYKCSYCDMVFSKQSCLVEHLGTHAAPESHKCSTCGERFTKREDLDNHSRSHLGGKLFPCPDCDKWFITKLHLMRHRKVHAKGKVENGYKCSYCDTVVKRKHHLTEHLRTHTGERPFPCPECKWSFMTKSHLRRHLRTHQGEKCHKCHQCGSGFTRRRILNEHIRSHHRSDQKFSCDVCGKAYMKKSHLERHSKVHEREGALSLETKNPGNSRINPELWPHLDKTMTSHHKCSYCGCTFSEKCHLDDHIKIHTGEKLGEHEDSSRCSEIDTGPLDPVKHVQNFIVDNEAFECAYCGSAFPSESDLNDHLEIHTGERVIGIVHCLHCDETFPTQVDFEKHLKVHDKPFECPLCPTLFSDAKDLEEHERTHLKNKITEKLKCPECEEVFAFGSELTVHMQDHKQVSQFACPYCANVYARKSYLLEHVRAHTGERPFKCPHCYWSFAKKSRIMRHLRTHCLLNLLECADCKLKFSNVSQLADHIKIHSMNFPYQCSKCLKCFKSVSALGSHAYVHVDKPLPRCRQCSKYFSTPIRLEEHLKEHLAEQPRPHLKLQETAAVNKTGKPISRSSGPTLCKAVDILRASKREQSVKDLLPKDDGSYEKINPECSSSKVTLSQDHALLPQPKTPNHIRNLEPRDKGICMTTNQLSSICNGTSLKDMEHLRTSIEKEQSLIDLDLEDEGNLTPTSCNKTPSEATVYLNTSKLQEDKYFGADLDPSKSSTSTEALSETKEHILLQRGKQLLNCPKSQHIEDRNSMNHKSLGHSNTTSAEDHLSMLIKEEPMSPGESQNDSFCFEISPSKPQVLDSSASIGPEMPLHNKANLDDSTTDSTTAGQNNLECSFIKEEPLSPTESQNYDNSSEFGQSNADLLSSGGKSTSEISLHNKTELDKGISKSFIKSCKSLQGVTMSDSTTAGQNHLECSFIKEEPLSPTESQNYDNSSEFGQSNADLLSSGGRSTSEISLHNKTELDKAISKSFIRSRKSFKGAAISRSTTAGQNRLECSFCGKTVKNKIHLIEHERIHTGERPFSCTECQWSFMTKSHLRRHMKTHARKNLKCRQYSLKFSSAVQLSRHLLTHTKRTPDQISSDHPAHSQIQVTGDTNTTKLMLSSKSTEKVVSGVGLDPKKGKKSLNGGIKNVKGRRSLVCSYCGYTFSSRHHLTEHERCHTGERPFPCTECEWRFMTKSHLRRHMRIHTGKKPHVCSYCGMKFMVKVRLVEHIRSHTG